MSQNSNNTSVNQVTSGGDTNIFIGSSSVQKKHRQDKFLNLVPKYNYKSLIDRVDIITRIHKILVGTNELIVLSGVGGIGKTAISLAYCNTPKFMEQYDHIAWVTVTDDLRSDLMSKLSNEETGFKYYEDLSTEDNFYNFISTLSKIQGNNLLIIDNANSPKKLLQIKNYLESLRWKILITSRANPEEYNVIDINELEFQHCKDLFLRHYKKKDVNDEALKHIFEKINYHTLLTELLAKASNKNPFLNIKKITGILKKQDDLKAPLLQNKITISNPNATQQEINQEYKLYDYIIAIFDIENLNENEKKYLSYFSVLPYSDISIYDLVKFFQIKDENLIDFTDTLNDLVTKGWLIQNNLENDGEIIIAYKCHQLIQTVVREKLDISADNLNDLIAFFVKQIEIKPNINWIDNKYYMRYVDEIIINIKEYNLSYTILLREYAELLNKFSRYNESIQYAEKALRLIQKYENQNKLEIAKTYMVLGVSNSDNGDFHTALKNKLKAKSLMDDLENCPNIELGTLYTLLAVEYRKLGEYDESIKQSKTAIEILKSDKSEGAQVLLAQVYDRLGFTYSQMKDYTTSLDYRLLAFDIRKQYLDENHPSYNSSLNNLGVLYKNLNQLDKALDCHKKSLLARIKNYGEYHPSTAFAYNNLSEVYLKRRDFETAIEFRKKAHDCLKILHKNHPRISVNKKGMANIYFAKKELDIALQYAEESFQIRKIVSKSEKEAEYQTILVLLQKIKFAILEREYWNFRRTINLTDDITPINLNIEKDKFLTKFSQNEKYNPIFKYENRDNLDIIEKLNHFYNKFSETDFYLTEPYKTSINKDIDWISNFKNKGVEFNEWLSSVYGKPNDNDIKQATEILETYTIPENKREKVTINAEKAQKFIVSKLQECGYDWNVKIQNMSAKMSVNSLEQTLKIKDTATFTESELNRLYVHEIETHVLRNENGKTQRYEIFSIGFPNYMATEEGLAILAEKQNNLRDKYDDMKYALRLVLCDKCMTMDFWDLFIFAKKYIPNNSDAFDMVARVKRGLNDTSVLGGYTKDQVYFAGYNQLKELPNETLKKLYLGKIGIEDLSLLSKLDDLNYSVKIPNWVR